MELEDWKLFWFYYLNYDFRAASLLSKYLCYEKNASQTIKVNENQNPFRFYTNEAKNNVLKVLLLTSNHHNLEFLGNFNTSFNFIHGDHILLAGKNRNNLIVKKVIY